MFKFKNQAGVLTGWRYGLFFGGLVGFIGVCLYPIVIHPMYHPEKYQNTQKETRKHIKQEDVQPGGMKVWSDPFGRK